MYPRIIVVEQLGQTLHNLWNIIHAKLTITNCERESHSDRWITTHCHPSHQQTGIESGTGKVMDQI